MSNINKVHIALLLFNKVYDIKAFVLYIKETSSASQISTISTKKFWTTLAELSVGGILKVGLLAALAKSLPLFSAIGSTISFMAVDKYKSLHNNMMSAFIDLAISLSHKENK